MELLPEALLAYADQYTSTSGSLLEELEAATMANHPKAHMISGKVQGKLLELLSRLQQPRRILEIGTFTGYSALCLAAGLPEDGELHTIELRESDAATARSYFNRSIWSKKIILHCGNALSVIPALQEAWDLVLIDADKVHYVDYYELVKPRLRSGGLIIADNVLFHGEVLETPLKGKNAKAIQQFNDYVAADPETEQVLLTVRDGLMLIRKK